MRRLSLILVVLLGIFFGYQFVDNPHGKDFKVSCDVCHSPESWKLDKAIYSYNHDETDLPLVGEHTQVNCRQCHPSLIFSEAGNECSDCHTDIHQNTVGNDCARCHTPYSWLVNNITEIHQMSRFPLLGAHAMADCIDCHTSNNFVVFEPLGVECFDCHQKEYMATTTPNHPMSGYSQDCSQCHNIYSYEWAGAGFNHNFFPLTMGHNINDCAECHQTTDFGNISPECFSCHEQNYNSTTKPNHSQVNIDHDCSYCHTTAPGWSPALFPNHNEYYVLNGAHAAMVSDCFACHNPEFTNTPTTCIGCHESDFNQTDDPNHVTNNFSTECTVCHSENSWEPATVNHDEFYVLTGAHQVIANNCIACHENGYSNTPNTCFACHETNYNQANDPNHVQAQFGQDCEACHSTNAWEPATYDHDNDYFPIYSGKHNNEWNSCTDCHTVASNYAVFSCIDCHEHNKPDTDDEHDEVGDYQYNSLACFECHPKGVSEDKKRW